MTRKIALVFVLGCALMSMVGFLFFTDLGLTIVHDLRFKGHGRYDVTAFGADNTGTTSSTTAIQAAIDAAGHDGEVIVPPGVYDACGLTIKYPIHFHGLGAVGWPSTSATAPTVMKCSSVGGVFLHVLSTSGSGILNHNGPTIDNLMIVDNTNSGAGGSATGAIWIDTTNRYTLRNIAVGNFSATGAYAFKLDQPNNSLLDSSYGVIEQPFVRNSYYGIWSKSYQDGTIIQGGEIVAHIGLYTDPAFGESNMWVVGTSFESVNSGDIGALLGSSRTQLNARFEAGTGIPNVTAVQVTGANNRVAGIFQKCQICVDLTSSSSFNQVDVSGISGTTISGTLLSARYRNLGTGNRITWTGRGERQGTNETGTQGYFGFWGDRQASQAAMAPMMLTGRGGLTMRNSPSAMQQMDATALSRDGAGNLTATWSLNHGLTSSDVGESLISDFQNDGSFNGLCTITSVPDSTHTVCTGGPATGIAGTAGTGDLMIAASLYMTSPDGINAAVGYGIENGGTNSSPFYTATKPSWFVFGGGAINAYCMVAQTVGTTGAREQCGGFSRSGLSYRPGSGATFLATLVGTLTANRNIQTPDGTGGIPVSGTFSSTAVASEAFTLQGATASSHCHLQATNASAATNVATTYVSAKAANQITVTHTATAGMTYDVMCTPN